MNVKSIERSEVPDDASNGSPVRSLMKERAYAELKRLLLDGDLAPGTFLAERQLAVRLGMSKTPVRSALERLEMEGFLSISPQQGAIVRELSVNEIADQYEIRVALETFVARGIAGKLTPAQVGRLNENLELQRLNLDRGNVGIGVSLDGEFHRLFCEFMGNQEILRVMGQLRDKTQRVISQVFRINASRMAGSYEEHCGIADAVIRGDSALAVSRIETHLRFGMDSLLTPRRS